MTMSVIIPACNEADYIDACLSAVAGSEGLPSAQVIVAANGCTDDTVSRARAYAGEFADMGWQLLVLDLPALGKLGALDAGDAAATKAARVYLDADVVVSQGVLALISGALSVSEARYVSGTPIVTAASRVSRAYARFWVQLPFVADGVPGFGCFAVNAAGRARWGTFPAIISDDTFVRIQFAPDERIKVPATYEWPIIEGFRQLVRVRRRQDQGVRQLAEMHPEMMQNEGKARTSKAWLVGQLFRDPVAFAVYAAVSLAVRMGLGSQEGWVRGR